MVIPTAIRNCHATMETGPRVVRSIYRCERCGCRLERKKRHCMPCSDIHREQKAQDNRARSLQRYHKATGEPVKALGIACRAAGITLADIEAIAKSKREASHG